MLLLLVGVFSGYKVVQLLAVAYYGRDNNKETPFNKILLGMFSGKTSLITPYILED